MESFWSQYAENLFAGGLRKVWTLRGGVDRTSERKRAEADIENYTHDMCRGIVCVRKDTVESGSVIFNGSREKLD